MIPFLCALCALLSAAALLSFLKVLSLRRAADELGAAFTALLGEDTNVGISISTSDKKMKAFAAVLDRQRKLLRKEHLRYVRGDAELKTAVTNISHDLRTPLAAICGYMELLSQEELPDTAREYLSIVENRVQTLRELTDELFRYSVVLSADSPGEREDISLNRALEECVAAYYAALKEAEIEPEIRMPEKDIMRRLNRQALSRILANIMSNAVKYSDGDLQIELLGDGTLHFANRADGLDEVQVGHLFERFYTVHAGKNATGLGFSIARALTEEQGGQICASYADGVLHVRLRFDGCIQIRGDTT